MKRTKQQWLDLLVLQQQSELSIAQFCRDHDLSVKAFYARRSNWLKSQHPEQSSFSKVVVAENPKPVTMPAPALTLSIGKAKLSIPNSTDVIWIAKLMEQFA